MKKIIKASAGTGKTYRLALEYIGRILQDENYNEILFMTFTRKATGELKQRIFKFLEELKKENNHVEKSLRELYPEIEITPEKILKIEKELLENRDKIRIHTIDSFVRNVFKRAVAPFLNIYNFSSITKDEIDKTHKSIFDELVGGKNFDKVKDFLEKNSNRDVEKYMELLKTLSANRWIFRLIDEPKENKSSEIIREGVYRNLVEIYREINRAVELSEGKKEFVKCLGPATKVIYTKLGSDLSDSDRVTDIVFKNPKLFLEKYYNGNQVKGKLYKEIKTNLDELQEEIHENVREVVYINDVLSYQKGLIEIEKIIRKSFDTIKLRDKKFDFADITNFTSEYLYNSKLELIEEGELTENFYNLIGGKIRTLFLDEAQDTSVSQWRIIEPIARQSENLIVVGDEKQSIYSWRGGNKDLFLNFTEILDAKEEKLTTNYRSEYQIMNFVNFYFEKLSKQLEDWDYNEVLCSRESERKGYLGVLASEEEELFSDIADDILEKYDKFNGIGILSRTKSELNKLEEVFKNKKIPYITESSMSIVKHSCVKSVIQMLKFLVNRDIFFLLEFLRDEVKISEELLLEISLNKKEILNYIFEDVEFEKSGELKELLDKVKEVKEKDYSEKLPHLLSEFEILHKYDNIRDRKNIKFFYELMNEYSQLGEFLEYLRVNEDSLLQLGVESLNSVVLMTVHKSKGLDFHSEYYIMKSKEKGFKMTGFEKGRTKHQDNLLYKMNDNFSKIEDYLFINSKYESYIKEKDIYTHAKKTFFYEELNILYVALTRPVANLTLCLIPRSTTVKKEKVLKLDNELLIPPILEYFSCSEEDLLNKRDVSIGKVLPFKGKEEKVSNFNLDSELFNELIKRDYQEEKLEEEDEIKSIETLDVNVELKRKEGLAIHYFLENVTKLEEENILYAKKLMLSKYGNMLGDTRIKTIEKKVRKFLKENSDMYHSRWTIYKELEIFAEGRLHIIDRLNVDHSKKEIMIYDYKTGVTMDREQLERYERVIREKVGSEYKILKSEFIRVR